MRKDTSLFVDWKKGEVSYLPIFGQARYWKESFPFSTKNIAHTVRITAGNEGSVSCQRTKRRTWKVLTKDAAAGAARGPAQLELLQERVLHAFTEDSHVDKQYTYKEEIWGKFLKT